MNEYQFFLKNRNNSGGGLLTAILDYVLVCQELYQYFDGMMIDEARQFTLTKYASKKGKGGKFKVTTTQCLQISTSFMRKGEKEEEQRKEIFNLKMLNVKQLFLKHKWRLKISKLL